MIARSALAAVYRGGGAEELLSGQTDAGRKESPPNPACSETAARNFFAAILDTKRPWETAHFARPQVESARSIGLGLKKVKNFVH